MIGSTIILFVLSLAGKAFCNQEDFDLLNQANRMVYSFQINASGKVILHLFDD